MQNLINKQVKDMKENGYSDERIFQECLDVSASASLLVMYSKAIQEVTE
tara:strand:+ start:240 stop:386 length:147 start_codon:yes stop_codon:yes gene_type:complete